MQCSFQTQPIGLSSFAHQTVSCLTVLTQFHQVFNIIQEDLDSRKILPQLVLRNGNVSANK